MPKFRPWRAFDWDFSAYTEVGKMEHSSIYQPSRIILAVETRLLRELLKRAITRSPFLKVVEEVSEGADLSAKVKRKEAEWVFVSLRPDGELPETAEILLANQPSVSIIAVAPDGSQVKLGWTEPCDCVIATAPDGSPIRLRWTESHQKVLTDLSFGELISVVRKGALWELAINDVEGISDVERYLSEKRVAALVADGFEQVELTRPLQALRNAGAKPDIISLANRRVKGWRFGEWGDEFRVDVPLESAKAEDYDALLLPGGMKNAETLSSDEDAIGFVKAFHEMGKPIVAICHGVWLLLEAGIVKGHRLTSCEALRRDLENAGAKWTSQTVVVDNGLVTRQRLDDIPEFNRCMIQAFAKGRTEK